MLSHIYVKIDLDDFEPTFKRFESEYKTFVGIFKGSIDPLTKLNWCPDCIEVEEPIQNVLIPLAQTKGIPILEVAVGQKEDFYKKTHPLRVHKKIAVKEVPTLLYITQFGVIKTLVEEQILDLELLREFLD